MASVSCADGGGNLPPFMEVTVTWDYDSVNVTLVRNDPDGVARPVRGAEPRHLGVGVTSFTVDDYEAPHGQEVTYTAMQGSVTTTSPAAVCVPPYYTNDQGWVSTLPSVWLKHLTIPALSMQIDLASAESPAFAQTRSVTAVLNRPSPVVLADARRKNPTTTLDVRTWSLEEADRLRALLADNSVLLLDVPGSAGWGIVHWYVAVGDVTEERLWQEWAPFPGRVFHLPVEVVDRPAGGKVYPACCYWSQQQRAGTYAGFDTLVPTYANLSACVNSGGGGGGGNGPDVGAVVGSGSETSNQGVYGSITTAPGPETTASPTTGFSGKYTSQAVPFVFESLTDYFSPAHSYQLIGDANYVGANTDGNMVFALVAVPGTSPATSPGASGVTILTKTKTGVSGGGYTNQDTAGNSGYVTWTPPAAGTWTVAWVLQSAPGGTWSTPDWRDSSFGSLSTTVYRPGTPVTTVTPYDGITATLTVPNLAAGVYTISAAQWLTNSPTAGTVTIDMDIFALQGGGDSAAALRADGSSIGAITSADLDGTTKATAVQYFYNGYPGATWEFGIRLTGYGARFSDATDAGHPRTLTVQSGQVT
jgi:hypothetical protein